MTHRFRVRASRVLSPAAVALAGCWSLLAPVAPAPAAEVITSFEFTDVDGSFTLGTTPNRVTFLGGRAQTELAPALYKSGLNSWIIDPGQTGSVEFESPVASVTLWLRDESTAVASVLTAFDENDNVVATIAGTPLFQKVALTASESERIAKITLANNGVLGRSVIDDFTSCASISTGPLSDPIPEPIAASNVTVSLQTVASGLTAPNWGTPIPGQPGRMAVTDQSGTLWSIELATGTLTPLLDVSSRLVGLGIAGPGTFDERGLLGVAFSPAFASSGLLYTYTSEPVGGGADFSTLGVGESADHQSVLTEWRIPVPSDPSSIVDPASARVLLRIDQPQFNHDGGALNFGPDGLLYVSLGDGGGADDEGTGHGTAGNGQDPANVLGSILRLDPLGSDSANGAYGIPPDNPFVAQPGFVPEIWAYGFRNPFRFSFDAVSGDMYVADVGQNDIEEIDIGMAGANFGWRSMEGSFFFDPNGVDAGFVTSVDPGGTDSLIRPIAEYDHDEGTAVIGGFVYRGTALPALAGRYVFGDFARTFNSDGRLFHLDAMGRIVELRIAGSTQLGLALLGFGHDDSGELYVLANATGTPSGTTGVVLALLPPPPLCGAVPEPPASCKAAAPGKASLKIKDKTPAVAGAKDLLRWKWSKGEATDVTDFADPAASAPVTRLCLYDAGGLRREVDIPAGGTCDGKPCWKVLGPSAAPRGFRYKNRSGAPSGVVSAKFKAGADGEAKLKIAAKGVAFDPPPLPAVPPVTVQLLVSDGASLACWQSVYPQAKKNKNGVFQAKSP